MNGRRYPLEPLLVLARLSLSQLVRKVNGGGREHQRWPVDGLSPRMADRLAGVCGFLPSEVWPSWFDDGIEDAKKTCPARGCGVSFVPDHPLQVYCCRTCKRREQGRRYQSRRYARDAVFAERMRERRRRFYVECGEYERARERRKYAAERGAA